MTKRIVPILTLLVGTLIMVSCQKEQTPFKMSGRWNAILLHDTINTYDGLWSFNTNDNTFSCPTQQNCNYELTGDHIRLLLDTLMEGNILEKQTNMMRIAFGSDTILYRRIQTGNDTPINGALPHSFTVNDQGNQVLFSKGNLQYNAFDNVWQFAEEQYDTIGFNNSFIGSGNKDFIDLFGWGTSGYEHGANCYQPWSISKFHMDYYVYGQENCNLYDNNGHADWGYNKIDNGGNREGLWRTLTGGPNGEWNYLLNERETKMDLRYTFAIVNSVKGLVLYPDDWVSESFDLDEGCVFLPAAGLRVEKQVDSVNVGGFYWASTRNLEYSSYANSLFFASDSIVKANYNGRRREGQAVRLVTDY